jgi:voltage-gated potassium channel
MSQWKFLSLLGILVALITFGTLGYHYSEDWPYLDSLYMTVIILSTVGLGQDRSLDQTGKIFTLVLIVFGAAFGGYAVNALIQRILEAELGGYLGRRRMEKETSRLTNHFILCGAGRVGTRVIKELSQSNVPFVIIEKDEAVAERLIGERHLTIVGDAADEETLQKAGIQRARGLIAAISTDADNVYVTLTAKGIRPDLMVVARAQEESAEKKLLKAGANKVILPYQSAGQILAHSALKPNVVQFIESVTAGNMPKLNLQLEEIVISEQSKIAGLTLQQSEIRQNLGIIVLAMKKKSGIMGFNPTPDSLIDPGDCLIVLGAAAGMRKLEEIAC